MPLKFRECFEMQKFGAFYILRYTEILTRYSHGSFKTFFLNSQSIKRHIKTPAKICCIPLCMDLRDNVIGWDDASSAQLIRSTEFDVGPLQGQEGYIVVHQTVLYQLTLV